MLDDTKVIRARLVGGLQMLDGLGRRVFLFKQDRQVIFGLHDAWLNFNDVAQLFDGLIRFSETDEAQGQIIVSRQLVGRNAQRRLEIPRRIFVLLELILGDPTPREGVGGLGIRLDRRAEPELGVSQIFALKVLETARDFSSGRVLVRVSACLHRVLVRGRTKKSRRDEEIRQSARRERRAKSEQRNRAKSSHRNSLTTLYAAW